LFSSFRESKLTLKSFLDYWIIKKRIHAVFQDKLHRIFTWIAITSVRLRMSNRLSRFIYWTVPCLKTLVLVEYLNRNATINTGLSISIFNVFDSTQINICKTFANYIIPRINYNIKTLLNTSIKIIWWMGCIFNLLYTCTFIIHTCYNTYTLKEWQDWQVSEINILFRTSISKNTRG